MLFLFPFSPILYFPPPSLPPSSFLHLSDEEKEKEKDPVVTLILYIITLTRYQTRKKQEAKKSSYLSARSVIRYVGMSVARE